jgi:hypothetical protein
MTALGHLQTLPTLKLMSAWPSKADVSAEGRISPTGPRKARPDDRLQRNPPFVHEARDGYASLTRPTAPETPIGKVPVINIANPR